MEGLTKALIKAKPMFKMFNPGWKSVFAAKWIRQVFHTIRMFKKARQVMDGRSIEDAIGEMIAFEFLPIGYLNSLVIKGYAHSMSGRSVWKKTRTWINPKIDSKKGRIVKKMNVVYHHANKAGKHLDIHMGHMSFIIRVDGKSVESEIKFNKKGELTKEAKDALMEHLKKEVDNKARVPQNWDHQLKDASETWLLNDKRYANNEYGSGPTRQVISKSNIEIIRVGRGPGKSLEIYAPVINKHRSIFLHKLYYGTDKKAPILVFGNKTVDVPEFNNRLNLKAIKPEKLNELKEKLGPDAVATIKEDGAGIFFHISKRGSTFWSPRISKETNERIEYTQKLPEMARLRHYANSKGIGELILHKRLPFGIPGKQLTAAEIGGILNADDIRPLDVIPYISIYRMDEWDGRDVSNLPFFENRDFQERLKKLSETIDVVMITCPTFRKNIEGLVIVPACKSVNEGFKVKFVQDPDDWIVKSVNFGLSNKGRITGVVWFKSLESKKDFKLGPGQFGSFNECMDIMNNPNKFIGRTAKVTSRWGHEGRASKFDLWHSDK